MRKVIIFLAILGGAYWWLAQPPKVAVRGPAVPQKATPAQASASTLAATQATPEPNLLDQPTHSSSAPQRKSPLNSALNLRSTLQTRAETIQSTTDPRTSQTIKGAP